MVADLFHAGHVAFLARARTLGDILMVGIHSDETVASYKRLPILTMEERIAVVEACKYVDAVIPDAPLQVTAEWLDRYEIDLVVHGDDFSQASLEQFYGVPSERGVLRLVPYTTTISTSAIIARVLSRHAAAGC
jgi:cytidyltransferase-like protein